MEISHYHYKGDFTINELYTAWLTVIGKLKGYKLSKNTQEPINHTTEDMIKYVNTKTLGACYKYIATN